jgi:hypothetical protein
MHTHGQLIHVEDFHIDSAHYRLAVFRVQGGLHGKWSCDGVAMSDDDGVHSTIEECISETKALIDGHHRQYLSR